MLGGNLGAGSVAHRGAHLGAVFLCPAGEGGGFVTVGDLDGKGVAHGMGSSGLKLPLGQQGKLPPVTAFGSLGSLGERREQLEGS